MDFMQEYEKWLHSPALSPEEHAELESIKDDPKEIESRFFGPLEFGTAGLRGVLGGIFDAATAESAYILYGGSMNEKNAFSLLSMKGVDGGLIGGASLDAEKFISIIKAYDNTERKI